MQRILIAFLFQVAVGIRVQDGCKGVAYRSRGHILIGVAQEVLTARTIDQCIDLCAASYKRFHFHCLSGIFYYKGDSSNCILNSQARRTARDFYVEDNEEDVEYFEIPCSSAAIVKRQATDTAATRNRNVLQLHSPEFGSWTMCDKESLQHTRFKECQTLNPNKCQKETSQCDPNKENEYDHEGVPTTINSTTINPTTTSPAVVEETTTAAEISAEPETTTVESTGGNESLALRSSKRDSKGSASKGKSRKVEETRKGNGPGDQHDAEQGIPKNGTWWSKAMNWSAEVPILTLTGELINATNNNKTTSDKVLSKLILWGKNETLQKNRTSGNEWTNTQVSNGSRPEEHTADSKKWYTGKDIDWTEVNKDVNSTQKHQSGKKTG